MNSLSRQFLRFSFVGVVNTFIGLSTIFTAMYVFRASPGLANAMGYGVGLVAGYGLNRGWTFRDSSPRGTSLGKYLQVVGISYLLNLLAVLGAISLAKVNPYLAQLLGLGIYTVCTFIGCRWFVFLQTTPEATFRA